MTIEKESEVLKKLSEEELNKILFYFYNYVMDEHGGELHEYQLTDYVESLKNK